MRRSFGSAVALGAFGLASATSCAPQRFASCAPVAAVGPIVRLSFPVDGATGVPAEGGVLVYSGSAAVPIRLVPSDSGTPVALAAVPLPSPLPSPIAALLGGAPYFASSYPALSAATTYSVQNLAMETEGCGDGSTSRPEYIGAGSFTTR